MEPIGKIIGRRKYEALKQLNLDDPTEENISRLNILFPGVTVAEAFKLVEEYENQSVNEKVNAKSVKEYFDKIRNPKLQQKRTQEMTKEWLWKQFAKAFRENEKQPFQSQDKDVIENLKPLMYYFLGNEGEFKKCKNVSRISKPSLKKGLLIIGGYGCGKSSMMYAFEKALRPSNIRFRSYSANEIVTMFEACTIGAEKDEFHRKTRSGTIYFDDVLTEREASNYGKYDLFKEIFEERCALRRRTYISCNYKDGTNNDLEIGLSQFGSRYGSRVYDRLFEMFNVVEFKGKSFRK